jgi:ketosteroid isomerase-like protein
VTPSEATRWLRAYAGAWERGDPGVDALFTPDAMYRSHVFREPHEGHAGIRSYGEEAASTQSGVRVLTGDPLVDGDRVAAEWWTTMIDEGDPVTLPGVLLLDFEDGRCRALREYWAYERGRHEPFAEWGRFQPGERAHEHAVAWAAAYERAWQTGDPDAAAALYSDDVVYRSHPFREPHRGRDEVRRYSADAYAAESERTVRFGVPLAAGASAAVEYWTTFTEDGVPKTLAGCALLAFDASGLVTTSREYWHLEDGTFEPVWA